MLGMRTICSTDASAASRNRNAASGESFSRYHLDQIPPESPEDGFRRPRANDCFHGCFRDLCFAAMLRDRREAGSEGSVDQTCESMNKQRI